MALADLGRGGDPATALRPPRWRDERHGRDLAHRGDAGGLPSLDRPRLRAARARLGRARQPALRPADRDPHARVVQGDRRGRRPRRSPRSRRRCRRPIRRRNRRRHRHDTSPRLDHRARRRQPDRDRARGVLGRRQGGALAGPAHRSLRSRAVPVAGRRPDRRLRPARPHGRPDRPPARPVQPVRPRRGPARAARMPACRRRRCHGQRPRSRPVRRLPRQRARRDRVRRAPARAVHRAGHPLGRAEPRARGLRRRRAGEPRDRPGPARPDPVHRELVRVRRGGAGRGAARDSRRDRGRGDRRRRRGAAEPARVRRVRHHPRAVLGLERRARHARRDRSIPSGTAS